MSTLRASALAAAAVLAAAWAAPALAHAHLEKSTLVDGAAVPAAPSEMSLSFSESVILDEATLIASDGAETRLEVTPASSASHTVPLPTTLVPGAYTFTWRASSDDGHDATGKIGFTVTGEHQAGLDQPS